MLLRPTPIVALALVGALAPTTAKQDVASATELRRLVGVLSADSMEGRATGSAGATRAVRFVMRELTPLSSGRSLQVRLQNVPMVTTSLDLASSRMTAQYYNIRPINHLLAGIDFVPLAGVLGIPFPRGASANGPVVPGGRLGSPEAIAPDSAAGRFVVFQPPYDDRGRRVWQLWDAMHLLEPYGRARAILVAALDVTPQSAVARLTTPHLDLQQAAQRASFPPVALISANAAALLLESQRSDADRGIVPMRLGVDPWRHASLDYRTRSQNVLPAPSNIVAILPGSDPVLRSEYVLVTANLDNRGIAGVAERIGGDSVFNGADEGGSGSAAMVVLARHFAELAVRPKRSLIFVWTTGGENGGLGAEWFVTRPPVPINTVVAAVTLGPIGGSAAGPSYSAASLDLVAMETVSPVWQSAFADVNTAEGLGFDIAPQLWTAPRENGRCAPDFARFAAAGVRSVMVSTGTPAHFHTVEDSAEKLDYEKMGRVVRLIASVLDRWANAPIDASSSAVAERRYCAD